jgi:hypothetical protein
MVSRSWMWVRARSRVCLCVRDGACLYESDCAHMGKRSNASWQLQTAEMQSEEALQECGALQSVAASVNSVTGVLLACQ